MMLSSVQKYFACLLLALGVLACQGSSTSTSKEQSQSTKLSIGVMPSIDHLPLALAQDLGVFDSLGIELELVRFHSPMDRDIALQTGQIDGAVSDYSSYLLQADKGFPLELPLALEGQFFLITRPELVAGGMAGLKNKKFALSSNTIIDYATDEIMGGQPYQRVEIQKLPIRLEMLKSGEVDAAVLPQPFAQLAIGRGLGVMPQVLGLETPLSVTGLVLHRDRLNDPTLLEKLKKGYNIAIERLNKDEQSSWQSLVARELNIDEKLVSDIKLGQYKMAHSPSQEDLTKVKAWLSARGLIK